MNTAALAFCGANAPDESIFPPPSFATLITGTGSRKEGASTPVK